MPSFAQYSFIRVMRALRPLRTLRFLPGMPVLIGAIFKAIPQLGSVAGLCAFIFLIFGIVGEELFEGALHYQCADPLVAAADAEARRAMRRVLKGGGGGGGDFAFCNPSDPHGCPAGEACLYFGAEPEGVDVDFDSVLNACMAIVQVRLATRRARAPPARPTRDARAVSSRGASRVPCTPPRTPPTRAAAAARRAAR